MPAAYEPAAPWPRADAHIHLVRGAADECSWAEARAATGMLYDEPVLYDGLTDRHGVAAALVASVSVANNAFIAAAAQQYTWCRPAAYFDLVDLSVAGLEALDHTVFAGIAMYLGPAANAELAAVDAAVWRWLDRRKWLVSCNDSGEGWAGWAAVLAGCPTLRLLASHLGSVPAASEEERERPPSAAECAARLGPLLSLAQYPGAHVKLSGFYAAATPSHDFPHRAAWGYVEALLGAFGSGRLVWGSDFSPCLAHLSFQQTVDLFARMPFLSAADREAIEGANLLRLL
jgi:predicted TIM-barrel fold metal-dependent hydrolase